MTKGFGQLLPPPRTRLRTLDKMSGLRDAWLMNWRHHLIVTKLAEGCLVREAAEVASVHRQTFWRWVRSMPDFALAVQLAREAGKNERTFRLWLRHPFRGLRPPTGKGRGGKPRFAYGRR